MKAKPSSTSAPSVDTNTNKTHKDMLEYFTTIKLLIKFGYYLSSRAYAIAHLVSAECSARFVAGTAEPFDLASEEIPLEAAVARTEC